jgi:hypothetical protein
MLIGRYPLFILNIDATTYAARVDTHPKSPKNLLHSFECNVHDPENTYVDLGIPSKPFVVLPRQGQLLCCGIIVFVQQIWTPASFVPLTPTGLSSTPPAIIIFDVRYPHYTPSQASYDTKHNRYIPLARNEPRTTEEITRAMSENKDSRRAPYTSSKTH